MNSIKVKVIKEDKSAISFKYVTMNSTSRMAKQKFLNQYEQGVFIVVNPEVLSA